MQPEDKAILSEVNVGCNSLVSSAENTADFRK